MCFVDHQHRIAEGVAAYQGAQPDGRIENVVVIAHHQIDLRQEVEADFERADRVLARRVEDTVRVLVITLGEKVFHKARLHQLAAVVAGVWAELLVADDFGVGAHLGLRP